MAIYVGENNALLLKNDRSVVEFYKGNQKIFGYNGNANGEIITVDNVHPIEHKLKVKLTSDTITDFSGVTVTRYGKNLLRYPYATGDTTTNGLTFTTTPDGVLTINGTLTTASMGYIFFTKDYGILKDGVTYSLASGVVIRYTDENGVTKWANTNVTWKKEYTLSMCYISLTQKTYNNVVYYPQIEVGSAVTAYEPYIKPVIITANADGTVEGLTSLSPNMTLLSDTDGVGINCVYVGGEVGV